MGQRANYFLIKGNNLTIHYHHWRALNITEDLFLGEKSFLRFVKDCRVEDTFLDEPWIEGCVIINLDLKKLWFWSDHFYPSSVDTRYFHELNLKWKGWNIQYLSNRTYDVETLLHIKYTGKSEIEKVSSYTAEEVTNDKPLEWVTSVVILKTNDGIKVVKMGDLYLEGLLNFGEPIVRLLLDKPNYKLPTEDEDIAECIVIDIQTKELLIGQSEFGLWELVRNKWDGYTFRMGTWGYIKTLQMANITTDGLIMSAQKAEEKFQELTRQTKPFDPIEFANKWQQEEPDIKFNPDFFDAVQPKKSFIQRITSLFSTK